LGNEKIDLGRRNKIKKLLVGAITGFFGLSLMKNAFAGIVFKSNDVEYRPEDWMKTGTVPTTIAVTDESADNSCYIAFFTSAVGDLAPKTGTNLTFNSSTGILTATGFAGSLTGHASSDALVGQTFYIGTTQVAINRASAALTLAGITLTTPNIGTPSAGVLTNCTGLPAAQLSGTIPAAVLQTEWDAAYSHSIDNTQAHSDYCLNTSDTITGTLTIGTALNPDADGGATFGTSSLHWTSAYARNYYTDNVDGYGYGFWDSDSYKIYMRQDYATEKFTSDFNMYFTMTAGTNRGFVFMTGTTPNAQIDASGNFWAKGNHHVDDGKYIYFGNSNNAKMSWNSSNSQFEIEVT